MQKGWIGFGDRALGRHASICDAQVKETRDPALCHHAQIQAYALQSFTVLHRAIAPCISFPHRNAPGINPSRANASFTS